MIESRRINTDKLISEGNQIVALKFVERPFRLTMAIKFAHQMPALESWKMFSWLFDHADANTFAATDQWEAIFRRPGNPSLRTKAFQALPNVVNVYRMPTFPFCVYSLNPDDGVLVGTAETTDIAHHGKTRVWISPCHIHQQ
ncbi:hypothetical protein JCM19237_295 [Photobacterium aphoticum]|uniref:Uncharacterized protein n=1 Tax=Photobacterium aphoticum TaxID=754436 RepID=A0A090QXI6_9GAMM|nr:hypothetical protein JCM19237_295 [Photobacterium aphoticum]